MADSGRGNVRLFPSLLGYINVRYVLYNSSYLTAFWNQPVRVSGGRGKGGRLTSIVEQVVMAQLLSHVFKKWNDRPDIYFPDEAEEEKTSGPFTSLELRSRQAEIESVLIDEGK